MNIIHISSINKKHKHTVFQLNRVRPVDPSSIIA
jgi:hypothetical protein